MAAERQAAGEWQARAMANFDRLESAQYTGSNMFKDSSYNWPGDWEGRLLLGWVKLAQETGREPLYLDEYSKKLPSKVNHLGYFGNVLPAGVLDEQQLSGNSWFLRGLCEWYAWKGEPAVLEQIQRIVEHLLLPAIGVYRTYPALPEQRAYDGFAIGDLQGRVENWYLSTDIGCAFIMLDGATHAYELTRNPRLLELIEEMAAQFMAIDIIALSFQTHATLSALRGLLRLYALTGNECWLTAVTRRFEQYIAQGMTESYANYNWFGRPSWTEPCAIVDAYLIAYGLWEHTGGSRYLDLAHHIAYNGLGYAQRPNGGFGCDCCITEAEPFLAPKEGLFEAYWCCTMRGGEGLGSLLSHMYQAHGDTVTLAMYETSTARLPLHGGHIALEQQSAYPYRGEISLLVREHTAQDQPWTLRCYIPKWVKGEELQIVVNGAVYPMVCQNGLAMITGKFPAQTKIELRFPIGVRAEQAAACHTPAGAVTYRHGVLMLGIRQGAVAGAADIAGDDAIGDAAADTATGTPTGIAADSTASHAIGVSHAGFSDSVGRAAGTQLGELAPLGKGRYRAGAKGHVLEPANQLLFMAVEEAERDRVQILF